MQTKTKRSTRNAFLGPNQNEKELGLEQQSKKRDEKHDQKLKLYRDSVTELNIPMNGTFKNNDSKFMNI